MRSKLDSRPTEITLSSGLPCCHRWAICRIKFPRQRISTNQSARCLLPARPIQTRLSVSFPPPSSLLFPLRLAHSWPQTLLQHSHALLTQLLSS